MIFKLKEILSFIALLIFGIVMSSMVSCSKKTTCPAYDNFAADHQNMNEGDGKGLSLPKKKRNKKSKKSTEWGLQGKKFKKTFKSYKPDKKQ